MREGWQQGWKICCIFRLKNDFFVLQDELLYYVVELLGKLSIRPAFNFTHNNMIKHILVDMWPHVQLDVENHCKFFFLAKIQ